MRAQKTVKMGNVLPNLVVREFDDAHQALCGACKGVGWICGETGPAHLCRACGASGVVDLCPHCGEQLRKDGHFCQESVKERQDLVVKKFQTAWTKAPEHITLDEARTRFEALYDVLVDEVVDVECLDSWLEEAYRSPDPILLYGTTVRKLQLDAAVIVQTACEDLYELEADTIDGQAVEELQTFLDEWCARHARGAVTYVMDSNVAVDVPPWIEEEEVE